MRRITSGRTLSVVAIAMHIMAPLQGCSAFSSLPIRNTNPIPGYYLKSGADSFHHSHPIKRNTRPNVSSSLHPGPGTLFSTQDVERELHGALEFARDMDRKHGLCTGPSQKAWNVVDEIYQTIQTLRDGGEHSNVVQRQSPRQSARRKVVFISRTVPIERETKGRRYFF